MGSFGSSGSYLLVSTIAEVLTQVVYFYELGAGKLKDKALEKLSTSE